MTYNAVMMYGKTIPQLSKTRFLGGLQCLKQLYLACYSPKLADPVDASQQALFDSGATVGELARQRFPEGRLIEETYFEHARAVASTQEALADRSIPSLYEAAFAFEGIRIRTDILSRTGEDGFDLVEVKSSTRVKPEHIPDAAIQMHVLKGSGVPVRKALLLHIDNSYVYQGGPYDLNGLFRLEDITSQAHAYLSSAVPDALANMWAVLRQAEVPAIEIGRQCANPYQCPFYGHCHDGLPEHYIEQLPRANTRLLEQLLRAGIRDIREIPSDFSALSATQQRVRDCVVSGQPYVGPELFTTLARVEYPLLFLDFETFNPALPVYPGTHPYQVTPFQWSIHVLSPSGQVRHESFLHDGNGDPRESLAVSLLDTLGPEGTIIVYSSYEQQVIRQLANACPKHADNLLGLCDRMLDLLAVLRGNYYHPDFHGSYSIKAVLPALAPEMGYGDLEIQDGSNASVAFTRMIAPDTVEPEREQIRGALLAYCRRDTEAMVQVFNTLRTQ